MEYDASLSDLDLMGESRRAVWCKLCFQHAECQTTQMAHVLKFSVNKRFTIDTQRFFYVF